MRTLTTMISRQRRCRIVVEKALCSLRLTALLQVLLLLVAAIAHATEDQPPAGSELPSSAPVWLVEATVNEQPVTIRGRLAVRAQDGGLLLESSDGQYHAITPANLKSATETKEAFRYASSEELEALLKAEFGPGFSVIRTRRYVIVTNANPAYGQWCGRLFERLQTAFIAYWKRAGMRLTEPDRPLVGVVWATPQQYAEHAANEAGDALAGSIGYYSARTNRMILCDLTRLVGEAPPRNEAELLRRLESQIVNVTTIIHEATHQIAFNSGMHQRYADNPMWLSEGLAMFSEAPDLRHSTGWRTIGRPHPGRLERFNDFALRRRSPQSLQSLVVSEDRFRDPTTGLDAYAESWALTYFLVRERKAAFIDYATRLSQRPPLVWSTPEQREQAFLEAFGPDWETLERDFRSFMQRVR